MRLTVPAAPVAAGSGYNQINDEATPLTQRTTISFAGAGVSAADSGGITVVTIPGGAGSGATGTTTVDFGAYPGSPDTSVAITGQTSIVAGSIISAWIRPVATADHSADEHLIEEIKIMAGNIVAGTGFTIYAFNDNRSVYPVSGQGRGQLEPTGCMNKHLSGQFTVQWKWE